MRLPQHCHDANVAGLEPKPTKAKRKALPDNTPDAAWVKARIEALEGDLDAQTALFEAMPPEIQDALWKAWRVPA